MTQSTIFVGSTCSNKNRPRLKQAHHFIEVAGERGRKTKEQKRIYVMMLQQNKVHQYATGTTEECRKQLLILPHKKRKQRINSQARILDWGVFSRKC